MKCRWRTQNTTSDKNQNTQYSKQKEEKKDNCEELFASEFHPTLVFQNDSLEYIGICSSNSKPMSALAWLLSDEVENPFLFAKKKKVIVQLSSTLPFYVEESIIFGSREHRKSVWPTKFTSMQINHWKECIKSLTPVGNWKDSGNDGKNSRTMQTLEKNSCVFPSPYLQWCGG